MDYEKIGRAVMAPLMVIVAIVAIPVLVVAYLPVALWLLTTGLREKRVPTKQLVQRSFTWPIGILALNELLSLGGFNSPTLSRITRLLGKLHR